MDLNYVSNADLVNQILIQTWYLSVDLATQCFVFELTTSGLELFL